MEGENFLDGFPGTIVEAKGNAGLCFLLAALQLQSQLDEKEFFEDETEMSRGARWIAAARRPPRHRANGLFLAPRAEE